MRICILIPSEESATRLAETLPYPAQRISSADRITREDDLILMAGWQQDGASACAAARGHTAAPIIVLIGDPSGQVTVEMLGAGADLVLPLSVDPDELQARIRALLRRQRSPCTVDAYHIFRLSDSAL